MLAVAALYIICVFRKMFQWGTGKSPGTYAGELCPSSGINDPALIPELGDGDGTACSGIFNPSSWMGTVVSVPVQKLELGVGLRSGLWEALSPSKDLYMEGTDQSLDLDWVWESGSYSQEYNSQFQFEDYPMKKRLHYAKKNTTTTIYMWKHFWKFL